MKHGILFRYLSRHLIITLLGVLSVLAALECVIGIIGELSSVGHGGYTFVLALKTVFLQLPMLVYDLFPVSIFLSVLLTLSLLGNRQEIVVMRAAGLSVAGFCWRLLLAVALITVVVVSLAEGFSPSWYQKATQIRNQETRQSGEPIHTGGHWFHDAPYFIYVGSQASAKELLHLQWFLLGDDQVLHQSGYAEKVEKEGSRWVAETAGLSSIEHGSVKKHTHLHYTLPMSIDLSQWQSDRKAAIGMTLWELHKTIEVRQASGASYARLAMAFWSRVWAPVGGLVLALLAVPFSFGTMRRFKTGTRLVIGVMVGFIFYMINQLLAPFTVVLLWSPFWVNCVPIVLFSLLAGHLLKKV